ncbi:MAG: DUF971 domain-containing protein [Planctomycetales bacterium]
MAQAPKSIRSLRDQGVLELTWEEGGPYRIPFKLVRAACPCASCIEEWTGRRLLDPATIPEDIHPEQMGFVGNYSLKIHWSDGHNTGLYTWDHLAELCPPPPK